MELVSAVKANDASRVSSALQGGADPNTTCSWDTYKAAPVLCYASHKQDMGVIEALLGSKMIKVDCCGDYPNTPLFDATLNNNCDIVRLLLSCGANPDLPSGMDKETPLLWAADRNHLGPASLLLSGGASPALGSGGGAEPPLVMAAGNGHVEMCRLLLQHNAGPDDTDKWGCHGIWCAAANGRRDVVQLLLDYGGDPTIKCGGLTPAEAARQRGHSALGAWLGQQRKLNRREAKNVGPRGTYPNETGLGVFLNFFQFSNSQLSNRTGSEQDKTNIENTFNLLNYRFECHENLSKSETLTVLKNLNQDKRLWYRDSLLLVISSHGAGSTAFYTSDGGTCNINELKLLFTDTNCPQMKNKPKLVIADWDRIESRKIVDNVSQDIMYFTTNESSLSQASMSNLQTHLGVIFSTCKGFTSFRNAETGSSFIQCFCETLKDNPKDDLNILINIISENMRAKGLPYPSLKYDHPFCKLIFKLQDTRNK